MKITFLGAAQTVTGSQYLINLNGHSLLMECGLYQGKRDESYRRNRAFTFNPAKLNAAILSHAHIDHSGNLPNLVKNGYHGPIYTTHATAHLSNIMLLDSAHVQESDVAFINKRRAKHGEKLANERPAEPLYTIEDAAMVAQYFQGMDYDQPFEPIPGVTARLVDAGHILGSAAIVLDVQEQGRKFRFWFSGDIGRRNLPLVRDPVLPDKVDYLLMESTYGNKPHRDPESAFNELREVVGRTVKRGGKVIIPSFAVGRTQELVYGLHQMIDAGELPRIPVIVDSPLAVNASDVFRAHPECFDAETQAFIRSDRHHAALGFDLLTYTHSVEESKALNDRKDPMVIISASGMCEVGRVVHHLRNNIEDPKNTILIVSWQAPDTLGRRLADCEKRVRIFGEEFEVRAEVVTIGGLSAHAGQDFLVEYASAVKSSVKEIILVHGEQPAASALSEKMTEAGLKRIVYPELGSSLEI